MDLSTMTRFFRRRAPLVVAPRDAYTLWAALYPARPHNALMRIEQEAMAPMIATTTPKRALDVGTGTGRYLPLVGATGARLVVGADLSMAMLGRQRRSAPLVCADACRLPFANGSFDLITASLMVGDVPDLDAWTAEMARLLAPGGHLVYSDFHPSWTERGWRRTFESIDGRRFEVSYYAHELEDHLWALEERGFTVRTIREPRLAFRAGIRREREVPVVVAFHAVKGREATLRLAV
jgi:malonyl-CoA O-methyltransferase